MSGKSDSLRGLKENVIIGKLIPAGTGLMQYRTATIEPTEEAKASLYPTLGYDDQFFGGTGEAIPLEEFDIRD